MMTEEILDGESAGIFYTANDGWRVFQDMQIAPQ